MANFQKIIKHNSPFLYASYVNNAHGVKKLTEERKTKTKVFEEAVILLALISLATAWAVIGVILAIPDERLATIISTLILVTGTIVWLATVALKLSEHGRARYTDC